MSIEQPIARVTRVDLNTFKVEMMPAELERRIIKSSEKVFETYLRAFSHMNVGDVEHVTELPRDTSAKAIN